MFQSADAPTAGAPLQEVLDRLAARTLVDGVLVMGSAATVTDGLTPWSDYDLLVVLEQPAPPLWLVLTLVDHRLTEVYFTPAAALEQLPAGERLPDGLETLRFALSTWLQTGRIAFDRWGRLEQVRKLLASRASYGPTTEVEVYNRWVHTNYNVCQTKRMAAADDPVYQMAVNLRLIYSLADLKTDYFAVRRLPYRGEKEVVRYWMEQDPPYLRLFQAAIAAGDRSEKLALYYQLAAATLALVGGLVPEEATTVEVDQSRVDGGDHFVRVQQCSSS